jgi:NADPH:quinone reductase-like Zn-dependent oxidoreductase
VLGGKVDTRESTCGLEYSGVVTAIGSAVTSLEVGDRVVVMAPNHFRLTETAPEWACQRLLDGEDYHVSIITALLSKHKLIF